MKMTQLRQLAGTLAYVKALWARRRSPPGGLRGVAVSSDPDVWPYLPARARALRGVRVCADMRALRGMKRAGRASVLFGD